MKVFALLDDGSTVSLIDDYTANCLELDGPMTSFKIQWINNHIKEEKEARCVSL